MRGTLGEVGWNGDSPEKMGRCDLFDIHAILLFNLNHDLKGPLDILFFYLDTDFIPFPFRIARNREKTINVFVIKFLLKEVSSFRLLIRGDFNECWHGSKF